MFRNMNLPYRTGSPARLPLSAGSVSMFRFPYPYDRRFLFRFRRPVQARCLRKGPLRRKNLHSSLRKFPHSCLYPDCVSPAAPSYLSARYRAVPAMPDCIVQGFHLSSMLSWISDSTSSAVKVLFSSCPFSSRYFRPLLKNCNALYLPEYRLPRPLFFFFLAVPVLLPG